MRYQEESYPAVTRANLRKPDVRKNLNDDMIMALTPISGKRVEISDAKCRGLQLRVGARGDKSFSVVCRLKGTGSIDPVTSKRRAGPPQRVPIGTWPDLTIEAARTKAIEVINAAQRGLLPGQLVGTASKPMTLAIVLDRYITAKKREGIRTWAKVESELRRHVVPSLGQHQLDKIKRKDVHDLLDEMVDDDLPGAAREVRKHIVTLMNWAEDRAYISVNPVRGMKRKDLAKNFEAGRALTDIELATIWRALPEIAYPYGDLVKMWMLTGQRRSDWSYARWAEIDPTAHFIEIPAARYKGMRNHVVPFSTAVQSVLNALPEWEDGDYLFTTTEGRVSFSEFSKAKEQLDDILRRSIPDLVNWRVHDLRVTCKTRLAMLGVPPDVRDAVIGHAKRGLDRIYDKHDRLDEKREALELYARHILAIVTEQKNMTPKPRSKKSGAAPATPAPDDTLEIAASTLSKEEFAAYKAAIEAPLIEAELDLEMKVSTREHLHAAVDRLFETTNLENAIDHSAQVVADMGLLFNVAIPALDIEVGRYLCGYPRISDSQER